MDGIPGVETDKGLKPIDTYERIRIQIERSDREWCPGHMVQDPGPEFARAGVKRLTELVGREHFSHIQFEVAQGSQGFASWLGRISL